MGVSLSKLVKQISYMDFKLVAGEKGLANEVRWLHMVDSDMISSFLQGGELVFTTGLGLNENLTLEKLVKEVYKMHASGIVINLGPYIDKIDESVIQFANENNFPVFETPWKTRMADIMHIFSFSINKAEQEKMELLMNLNNAFSFPSQKEMYAPFFNKKGFLTDWKYVIATIHIIEEKERNASSMRYQRVGSRIESYLQYKEHDRILCTVMENKIILMFADKECQKKEEIMEDAIKSIAGSLLPREKILAAVGNLQTSLLGIKESYEYAEKIVNLMKKTSFPGTIDIGRHKLLSFENMSVYKVLLSLTDKNVMLEYIRESVEPLFEYDKMNGGDLTVVLESYLRHSGSLKKVAEELIIHRNTVNYKIKKIEDILGVNLVDLSVRFEIMLGLMLKKII